MDNKRRSKLREALEKLSAAEIILDAVCDKEQDCLDGYPENLQGTDAYEKIENAVDSLNDALEMLSGTKERIEEAIA